MKNNIVFWGSNANDEEILIFLQLRAEDNKVDLWAFPKAGLEEAFIDKIFKDRGNITPDDFPENHTYIERSMSDTSLLPDDIKTKDTDLVNRAEKEWFVKVLSLKLAAKLNMEVSQMVEQAKAITEYDKELWDMAKSYWDKVNRYFQLKDLTREQASSLRDKINVTFNRLKELRAVSNERFEEEAKAAAKLFLAKINDVLEQTSKNANLNQLWEGLKKMQAEIRKTGLTRDLRREVDGHLNRAFNTVRDARRGAFIRRLESRINGLTKAIERMEKSLRFDEKDLRFQNGRLNASNSSQLEAQLREAKIAMIQSRVDSKRKKLDDMHLTFNKLKKELDDVRKREEAERKRKIEQAAKREAEQKIRKIQREAEKAEASMKAAKAELEEAMKAEEKQPSSPQTVEQVVAQAIAENKADEKQAQASENE